MAAFKLAGRGSPANETLGRLGSLEVRLARNAAEVRRAQRLRYRVFYKEGSAIADAKTQLARRDIDAFDSICDHLLVIDHAKQRARTSGRPWSALIGCCAQQHRRAVTAASTPPSEFDIGQLVTRHPILRFLELGRSCVLAPYRNKRTVELLWHGSGPTCCSIAST